MSVLVPAEKAHVRSCELSECIVCNSYLVEFKAFWDSLYRLLKLYWDKENRRLSDYA